MAWELPIYDRTSSDAAYAKANQSSTSDLKGALNASDLNRIESNTIYLRDAFAPYHLFANIDAREANSPYHPQGKNLLSMGGTKIWSTYGYLTQADGTAQAILRDYDIIVGMTRTGVIYPDCVHSYSINPSTNSVSVRIIDNSYWGVGFKVFVTPGQPIAFTDIGSTAMLGYGFFKADGTYISNGFATTETVPADTAFMFVVIMVLEANTDSYYNNAQVEIGTVSTAFEPYRSVPWNTTDIFYTTDLDRIRQNVLNLVEAFVVMESTPTISLDNYRLSVKDINDIEHVLHDLDMLLTNMISIFRRSGTFYAGGYFE